MGTSLRSRDYRSYQFEGGERIRTAIIAAGVVGLLALTFYRSAWAIIPLAPLGYLVIRLLQDRKAESVRENLADNNTINGENFVPCVIVEGTIRITQSKIEVNVAGIKLTILHTLFPVHHILHLLSRNKGVTLQQVTHLLIIPKKTFEILDCAPFFVGKYVKHIPLILRFRNSVPHARLPFVVARHMKWGRKS